MTDVNERTTHPLPVLKDRERKRAIAAVARPQPGRYLVIDDAHEAVVLELEAEITRIGRSPATEVQLDEPTISRRHAMIVRRGEHTVVLDDRSLNGVFVNHERVTEATLRHGDTITLGAVQMRYVEVAPDREALPA